VGQDAAESREWLAAIEKAIGSKAGDGSQSSKLPCMAPQCLEAHKQLTALKSRSIEERVATVTAGASLVKYNQKDGSSEQRWVVLQKNQIGQSVTTWSVCWGDAKKKTTSSELSLSSAKQLLHGAKSATFFKMRTAKKDPDWLCFSIVSKERTLDFAVPDMDALLDWCADTRARGARAHARAERLALSDLASLAAGTSRSRRS
jgi:hypothetical protein